MTERSGANTGLAVGLGLALLAGILVGWSPRYWRIGVAMTAIALVGAIWALTASRIELPRQTVLVVLMALWGPMQLMMHITRAPWPTTQRSIEWAMGAICFILGSQILRGRRNRDAFLNLMLWAMTALAVEAMLQTYLTPDRVFGLIPAVDGVIGTLYYKNWFAAMMELAAPIALWRVYNGKVVSGGLCFAAMFAATLTSASRTGVILISAELLVALLLMVVGRRMPLKSAVSGIAILALLVAAASFVAGTEQIQKRFEEANSFALRRMLLSSTLKMIPLHPWLGSGMGTWPSEYPGFATYDADVYVNEAHNDWAQWASEGGLPFFLLVAALVIWLVKPSLQSVWGLGLLSVMIHSFVDYPLRDQSLGLLWFTLAGGITQVGTHARERRSRKESPEDADTNRL